MTDESYGKKINTTRKIFFFLKKKYIKIFINNFCFRCERTKRREKNLRDINSRLISLKNARCEISRLMG